VWVRGDLIPAVAISSSVLHDAIKYGVGVREGEGGSLVMAFTTFDPFDFLYWIHIKVKIYISILQSKAEKF
jgi:hypothetical protein